MLFVAVTAGFFVENMREQHIENKRAKEYMVSMIADLKTDTAKLNVVITGFKIIKFKLDTLLDSYDEIGKGNWVLFWKNLRWLRGYPDFVYTDDTIQQLKNSGGLRLIRSAASDSIMNYDSYTKDLLEELEALQRDYELMGSKLYSVINFQKLEQIRKPDPGIEKMNEYSDFLLTHDTSKLGELYNLIWGYKSYMWSINEQMKKQRQLAERLISFLQKEYHVE